jgi:citrate lyase beta subunit
MANFVASKGFALGKVFVDTDDSASSAFATLIDALRDSHVTVVAVPSVRNFARIQSVAVAMMKLIESETGACVMIVSTPSCGQSAGTPADVASVTAIAQIGHAKERPKA